MRSRITHSLGFVPCLLAGVGVFLRRGFRASEGAGRALFPALAVFGLAASQTAQAASIALPALSPEERVVRELRPDEESGDIRFTITLPMLGMDAFDAKLAAGIRIRQTDLARNHLPAKADYDAVTAWASRHGFAVTQQDSNNTVVFLKGPIARVESAFGVRFARISTPDGELSSAVSAAIQLPDDLPVSILSVHGLQPHRLWHRQIVAIPGGGGLVTPADVMRAYNWPASFATNTVATNAASGQFVALFLDETQVPNQADFDAYCHLLGLDAGGVSWANNVTLVSISGATLTQGTGNEGLDDICQIAGFAPGCKIRLYVVPAASDAEEQAFASQLLSDIKAGYNITVASISYGGDEATGDTSTSQSFAQLANAGVSVFVASGDGGSNPNSATEPASYSPASRLAVAYPATDPYVTSIGATEAPGNGSGLYSSVGFVQPFSESVWEEFNTQGALNLASSGGYSEEFAQPVWQADGGRVLTKDSAAGGANARCVPDVSVVSGYGIEVFSGHYASTGATSTTCPMFAGMIACVNGARAAVGKSSLGLVNPALYAYHSAFNRIVAGTNGAYSAQPDGTYNLCTGLGSPNWAMLLPALVSYPQVLQAPTVSLQPAGVTVANGHSFSLAVTASGGGLGYQWGLNGVPIPGGTSSTLLVSDASGANAGTYTCAISNPLGSVSTSGAAVSVVSANDPGRLINLSCRAAVGNGANILIAGFVAGGNQTSGSQSVLVRGSGPALIPFGVTGVLADPQIQLYQLLAGGGSTLLQTNDGWGGAPSIAAAASAVGAFSWTNNSSHDSALLATLSPGNYTAEIAGQSGDTGVALAEVYDATPAGTYTATTPRLINLSARVQVKTSSGVLIAGFAVGGSTETTVLVRVSGPALAGFGVTGTLPDPQVQLYQSLSSGGSSLLQTNSAWAGDGTIAAAAQQVGAFSWSNAASHDCAVIATLPPGTYTAVVSGAGNDSGVALVEVYEVQ